MALTTPPIALRLMKACSRLNFTFTFPTDLKQTQSSEIMCCLSQPCMEFLTILGTTALMASNLRHPGQLQSLHPQNLAPWPKTAFDSGPNFVCHFLFHFLRIETLELTVTKHLWTYLHLNVRNKLSFMNMLVELLYSLRQGFLTFFCAMDPFERLVKPNNPFSQNKLQTQTIYLPLQSIL